MKRFWTAVSVAPVEAGWQVLLDGRALRTPAQAPLVVPTQALADAIAAEWQAVEVDVDPRAMPLTGLANAAIDRIASDAERFAAGLAAYGESDLLCYRAEAPSELVERQAAEWDPLLRWAQRRHDVHFNVTRGIRHVPQPQASVARLRDALALFGPFALAALSPLVTIGGSLIAALALANGGVAADEAWHAVSLDERWNLEKWGEDSLAVAALDQRRRDFLAAAKFLDLAARAA